MNITGLKQYSKATVGLRQPGKLLDQHLKMVFVYPMLFADKLGKYKTFVRQFQTITFLKEIFISNSLNLMSLGAQVKPIIDEQGQEVEVATVIGMAKLTGMYAEDRVQANRIPAPNYISDFGAKNEIQRRIHERTAVIQQLVNVDPRLSALMPFVELITMDNLIDIPVIVGTKTFDIDTLSLTYILIAAIGLNIKLDSEANINKIIEKLKSMPQAEWYKLVNNIIKPNKSFKETMDEWLKSHPAMSALYKKFESSVMKFKPKLSIPNTQYAEPDAQLMKLKDKFESDKIFGMLTLVKQDLDQAKLFFKFMLNPDLIKSQTGLDVSPGQISSTIRTLSPNTKNIFLGMHQNFMKLVSNTGTLILRSSANVIHPKSNDIDYIVIKENVIDTRLNSRIQAIIADQLMEKIETSLADSGPEIASDKVKTVTYLCNSLGEESQSLVKKMFTELSDSSNNIASASYDHRQFSSFVSKMEEIASTCASHNKAIERQISELITDSGPILQNIQQEIYGAIDSFFDPYIKEIRLYGSAATDYIGVHPDQVVNTLIKQLKRIIIQPFYFLFLYSLQVALCEYVKILDVELDATKNDVLSLPNYTLILPLQVVSALYSVVLAKSWQDLVKNDTDVRNMTTLTENYVKNIVKFINLRLGVPNIIVIDEQKGKLYYKFQFMTAINATSITTLETFIQSHLNKPMNQNQNYY
jgi:hypothetical protein